MKKLIYTILFIIPICLNEVVLQLINVETTIELNILESSPEDSGESESSDSFEDESKIEQFTNFYGEFNLDHLGDITSSRYGDNVIPQPLMEIFSPPPELHTL